MEITLDHIAQRFDAAHGETKGLLSAQKTALDGQDARLRDIEQKLARRPGLPTGPLEHKSLGAQVTESQAFADYKAAGAKGRTRIEVKAIVPLASTGSAGALTPPDRQAGVDLLARRPIRVKALLRPGRTEQNLVQVMRQTSRSLNAATVQEGDLKPQSDLGFALVDYPVRTIAHFVMASKQVLGDAPVLQETINTELTYGLELEEDQQLLNGDGTGTNLLGLIPQATAFNTGLRQANDTFIDTVRRGLLQARLALYPATGVIMHPQDWAAIETVKDSQGRYIFGDPATGRPAAMWNCPVVETEAIAQGHFLVGAFGTAAQVFDREDDAIYVSTEDRDNFVRNLVTILAEERLALAVRQPAALVYGAF